MSRSVNYLNDAIAIAFVTTEEFSGIEPCDLDCQEFFKEAADDVAARLREKWPSFEEADSWDNRETRIVAENYHAVVGVSEYCGLTRSTIPRSSLSWPRAGFVACPMSSARCSAPCAR